jgi:hypothetical protein
MANKQYTNKDEYQANRQRQPTERAQSTVYANGRRFATKTRQRHRIMFVLTYAKRNKQHKRNTQTKNTKYKNTIGL